MECNKDEALRAKGIAEDKIMKKDFIGAKKFALKAQALFPGLDGIPQMITTLDVYVSAENKVSGEMDWYGILGVNPSVDDDTIKKQFKKLALMLHPDKNKSPGAEGAFQLISEAFNFLSDKTKRLAYNQKRGFRVFQQRVPTHNGVGSGFQQRAPVHTGGPSVPSSRVNGSVPSRPNGHFNIGSRNASVPRTQSNNRPKVETPTNPATPPTNPTTPLSSQRTDTFWTICHRCKMHYEYLKMYLNNTLLCPNCQQPFTAKQTSPPFNYRPRSSNAAPKQQQPASSNHVHDRKVHDLGRNEPPVVKPVPSRGVSSSFNYKQYPQDPLSGTGSSAGSTDPSIAAKAASVVRQAQEKLKRSYNESCAFTNWNEYTKSRKVDDNSSRYGTSYTSMAQGNGTYGTTSGTIHGPRTYGFSGQNRQPNSTRDLAPMETRHMLASKARNEISDKLNQWKTENAGKPAVQQSSKSINRERHKSNDDIVKCDRNGNVDLSDTKLQDQQEKAQPDNSADDGNNEDAQNESSMTVPDPDFHDFDQDRTESTFEDNEVWAAYDDDDGMPRFYALISKVISRDPFKLKISWLNSKTNGEFSSSVDWVGSGFYKTCGEFRIGKYENCKHINSFSQKVNWSKGLRGSILILPKKGDVWAMYKNWSPDWDEHTPDEVIHKYEMVMVLEDYNDEKGVPVAPLVKAAGFKTVFRPNSDKETIKTIPKEEMFRLSHRVPNHILTGNEGVNAPKGYVELDPAATPLELLQVITEASDDSKVPVDGENGNEGVA